MSKLIFLVTLLSRFSGWVFESRCEEGAGEGGVCVQCVVLRRMM